jgi:polyphenol oxidase
MSDHPPSLAAPALERLSMHVRHGFFGRRGGVSHGGFRSLNCGLGTTDNPDHVAENRARVCRALGASPDRLASLRQVHSATVVTLAPGSDLAARPEADALVTRTPGLVLGVLAADCAPVLAVDPHAAVIGAAHAGWRGATAGVADAMIDAMQALGADPGRIVAAIGPCLSQASFEVGPDLVDAVLEASPWAEPFFTPGAGGRSQFDLKAYLSGRLARSGVGHVEALAEDTLTQPEHYFSYRGARAANQADYGRNLSAIVLLP